MIQKLAMNHSDCMLENIQMKQQVKFLETTIQRLSKKAIQYQEIATRYYREMEHVPQIKKQGEVNKKNVIPRRSKRTKKPPAKFKNYI